MTKRMRMAHGLAALALAATAWTAWAPGTVEAKQATPAAARHAESGLPIVPLSVVSGKKRHRFRVEVAASPQEQMKGLMFRKAMGKDEGMIFPRSRAMPAAFWMKNTLIPLDIIFVGADGRILNIGAGRPRDETPVPSIGPAKAILELNGGRAAQLGIKPGDLVEW